MDQIAGKVRAHRTKRGWTIDQLGKRAGYTNGTMIHQIEKGSKKPSYRQLKAIAQALEAPVSDLTDETPACQGVTNNANGDHQVVYQHVERLALMTEEFQVMLRQVVTEVVNARCEQLLEEMQQRFPMLQDAPSDDHAQEEGGP